MYVIIPTNTFKIKVIKVLLINGTHSTIKHITIETNNKGALFNIQFDV